MALLRDRDAAMRLARAIASDIRLYEGAKLAAGEDVRSSVDEGRELFRSRVAPEHYLEFELALEGPLDAYAQRVESRKPASSDAKSSRSSFTDPSVPGADARDADLRLLVGLIVVLVVLAAAAGAYVFAAR